MKIIFIIFFAITFSLNLKAQYFEVSDKDTISLLNSKIFDFIQKNLDSLNTGNFAVLKADIKKIVFYGTVPDSLSKKMFKYLIDGYPPFKAYLKSNDSDTLFRNWQNTKRYITFSDKKTNGKERLDLSIFPPVKSGSNICMYILALSPGYEDDMYGTHLFFTFNTSLQLISFRSDQVLY